nr:MAG TPA: minor structural protein [Caudoviricetes sp.]
MDIFRRQKFNEAMFAKNRTLAIRVGAYQSGDIKEASFDYGYIKGDTYKPGGTCAGSGKITFTSIITTFNKLDKIYPEIGLLVDGTYEWVKMGEYFINNIEIDRNRNTTTLELMDGMFKLNREYVTDLTYPADIKNVIKEICLKTGIKLANEIMDVASMNYQIDKVPENKKMTFRDVLSLATQMLGMSCFFNREGKLEIKELTDSGITITADSYFMHGLTKSEIEYQIAGITCKKDKETLTVGLRTGRSLEIENVFMYQAALDNLYHSIKNIRYYPFNLNYQGHLLLDVGQWVTIKTNTGETFKSPILSQSFSFKGGLRGRISADSKAGNDAQYSYAGTITKKILQFDNFEAQLQNEIEEADRGFDAKVDQIKQDFSDQIELIKAKAEENKKKLSDEINRRFQEFNPAGFDEAKAKAEEAFRKAGASADLAFKAKALSDKILGDVNTFKSDYRADLNGINLRIAQTTANNAQMFGAFTTDINGRMAQMTSAIEGKVNQADFQTVKETAQLYERILGGAENDVSRNVSRMVLSNQVFQTEVGKYVTDDNNLVVNSMTMDKHTLVNANRNGVDVSLNDGVFTVKANGLTGYNFSGFTLPIYVKKIYRGETYTLGFKYRIRERVDANFAFVIKNHKLNKVLLSADIPKTQNDNPLDWFEFQKTFTVTEDFAFGEDYNFPFYIYIAKNGWIEFKEPILVRGSKTGPYKPSQFDDAYKLTEATRTQVTQLAGSYAIKNLNSAGDLINGVNFAADGTTRFVSKLTHISGDTLIDNAVIKSAMIDKLKTANFEAGSVTTNILGAEAVTAEKVKFDTAFIQRLVSQQAFINELFAKQATITKIQSIDFTGNHIKGGRISSLNGKTTFDLQSGWIDMNTEAVGIRNRFNGKPLQFLIFGQGAINGVPSAYTQLMSNRNGVTGVEHTSAGIQIWNGKQGDNIQTAITFYGKSMDFMPSSQGGGIIMNTENRTISNLDNIYFRGTSLVTILDLIDKNFKGIEDHFKYNNLGAPGYYRTKV